jgi:hypothetical protein
MSACEYFTGLDLGQVRDHRAIAVVERTDVRLMERTGCDVGVSARDAIVFTASGSSGLGDFLSRRRENCLRRGCGR